MACRTTSKGRHHSTSSFNKVYSVEAVQSGMVQWINQFVIEKKICPYAKGSSYDVHVWPYDSMIHSSDDDETSVLEFASQHLENLTKKIPAGQGVIRPNMFLTFPNIDEFDQDFPTFFGFYQAMLEVFPTVGGDADCTTSEATEFQAFAFHPQYVGSKNNPFDENLRFQSPWPSIHFIAKPDLEKERSKATDVSKRIFDKNAMTLQDPSVHTLLKSLYVRVRSR